MPPPPFVDLDHFRPLAIRQHIIKSDVLLLLPLFTQTSVQFDPLPPLPLIYPGSYIYRLSYFLWHTFMRQTL